MSNSIYDIVKKKKNIKAEQSVPSKINPLLNLKFAKLRKRTVKQPNKKKNIKKNNMYPSVIH